MLRGRFPAACYLLWTGMFTTTQTCLLFSVGWSVYLFGKVNYSAQHLQGHTFSPGNLPSQANFLFFRQMYNQFPTLLHYLPGKHQSAFINLGTIKQFIREEVEKHKEDRNPSNPRDYIDCYLEEIEKVMPQPDLFSSFLSLTVTPCDLLSSL